MGQGISAVLTFAIGVAISPVPIIAVILMLFSQRARVNGPAFLVGWVVALTAVSTIVYVASHDGNVAQTSSTASDSVSWGTIALGVGLLALARRNWRKRPAPGVEPAMPKWLATVETVSPVKALGLGIALAAVNPKNLILTAGAAAGLAQVTGLTTTDAVVGHRSVRGDRQPHHRRSGRLLAGRRGEGEGLPRLGEDLAHRAQRSGDGRAVPRLRRRPDRQGPPAADALSEDRSWRRT